MVRPGLIPTSENVLSGLKSFNEWHQPVVVHGYLVSSSDASKHYGYQASWHKADDATWWSKAAKGRCARVRQQDHARRRHRFINGNADDEWVYGDVPFLGRGVLFVLPRRRCGGRRSFHPLKTDDDAFGRQSMRTLIGDEGMKKAASVKSDAKAAKKAGMESPDQRRGLTKSDGAEKKQNERFPKKHQRKRKMPGRV